MLYMYLNFEFVKNPVSFADEFVIYVLFLRE